MIFSGLLSLSTLEQHFV